MFKNAGNFKCQKVRETQIVIPQNKKNAGKFKFLKCKKCAGKLKFYKCQKVRENSNGIWKVTFER